MPDQASHIGEQISAVRAAANVAVTAGGAGDATEVVGDTFDLQALGYPEQVTLVIPFTTTLAANKTLTLKNVAFEHGSASNLSDTADLFAPADIVWATDSGSGSTMKGVAKYNFSIGGAKRYVRVTYTPDLNASGTDTAAIGSAVFAFAAPQIYPAIQPLPA